MGSRSSIDATPIVRTSCSISFGRVCASRPRRPYSSTTGDQLLAGLNSDFAAAIRPVITSAGKTASPPSPSRRIAETRRRRRGETGLHLDSAKWMKANTLPVRTPRPLVQPDGWRSPKKMRGRFHHFAEETPQLAFSDNRNTWDRADQIIKTAGLKTLNRAGERIPKAEDLSWEHGTSPAPSLPASTSPGASLPAGHLDEFSAIELARRFSRPHQAATGGLGEQRRGVAPAMTSGQRNHGQSG